MAINNKGVKSMKKILIVAIAFMLTGCGLQNQINDLKNRANLDESQINSIAKRIQTLEYTVDSTKAQLLLLANNDKADQVAISTLQAQYATALSQLATLNGYTNIVGIKDPCGAQGTYNEIYLKISDGRYLGSYSQSSNGMNTRFIVLTDGDYTTMDGTSCKFTVSKSGTVISNEHN